MGTTKEINLTEIMSALLRKLWLIVLCAVVAGALSYGYTARFITPLYKSRVTMYVNNNKEQVFISNSITATDLATSQRLVPTYIHIIKSDHIMDLVAEKVGAKSGAVIKSTLAASPLDETEIFEVVITHPKPVVAQKIAQAVMEVVEQEAPNIVEGSSVKPIDAPKVATSPSSPNKATNTIYGMLIGTVLAVGFVVLQTLLDVRVKGEEDLAVISDAPVLGLIPDLAMESRDRYGYSGYSGYKYSAYGYRSHQKKSENGEEKV